jgi:hypothetical protein
MSIRNTLLVLLFGGVTGTLLLREQQRGTLEPLDRAHREFLKANPDPARAHRTATEPTVVFARMDDIDQPNKVFAGWPLTAADWQIILQNLPGYAPATIALAAPLPPRPAAPALEEAAKNLPGLLVGAQASSMAGDGGKEIPPALPVLTVRGSTDAIPALASLNLPAVPGIPGVERIEFAPKDRRLSVDGDSCRVPMLARMGEKVVPSLALRALMEWAHVTPANLQVQMGVAISSGTKLRIPIDEGGFFRYFLSLAPQVPAVNADEFVLSKPAPGTAPAPGMPVAEGAEKARGSLLWVGYDDKASRNLKLPNGSPVSPSELTARALAAIQTGAFMRPLNFQQQWVAPAVALVFCLWLAHWRKSWALLAAAGLAGASLYLYRERQEWMPIGPSLGIVGATTLLAFILPPPPRRGKPAIIPGTRTATRTRTRQPTVVPAEVRPESNTLTESLTPEPAPPLVLEPVEEPVAAPASAAETPPTEPQAPIKSEPDPQPEAPVVEAEAIPESEAPTPAEVAAEPFESAPIREPVSGRKNGKKKRRR